MKSEPLYKAIQPDIVKFLAQFNLGRTIEQVHDAIGGPKVLSETTVRRALIELRDADKVSIAMFADGGGRAHLWFHGDEARRYWGRISQIREDHRNAAKAMDKHGQECRRLLERVGISCSAYWHSDGATLTIHNEHLIEFKSFLLRALG